MTVHLGRPVRGPEVEVGPDETLGLVQALQKHVEREACGPRSRTQPRELRPALEHVDATVEEARPVGDLGVVRRRRDVETDLVDAAAAYAGEARRRGCRGSRMRHQTVHEPAGRAQLDRPRRLDGGILDVHVEVHSRDPRPQPLHPQVVVALRRGERRELVVHTPWRGADEPGHALPEADCGLEVGSGEIEEGRQPERHRRRSWALRTSLLRHAANANVLACLRVQAATRRASG
ncbi:hypothetical protein GCM10009843_30910 [Nocardioides bigeumensis]|uniref:Uncharacterized protein n=1 Tax=Nocardioides bigeumensis TaxID=433657 RepID=A0ABN2YNW2_9ACTN